MWIINIEYDIIIVYIEKIHVVLHSMVSCMSDIRSWFRTGENYTYHYNKYYRPLYMYYGAVYTVKLMRGGKCYSFACVHDTVYTCT